MQGRRLQETGGVFSAIRRGFLGAENDADTGSSFAAVEWHYLGRFLETPLELEPEQIPGLKLVGGLGARDRRGGKAAGVDWKGGRVPRCSLRPRIGDSQFERTIELILEPQLCFPHRLSRRITLQASGRRNILACAHRGRCSGNRCRICSCKTIEHTRRARSRVPPPSERHSVEAPSQSGTPPEDRTVAERRQDSTRPVRRDNSRRS